MITSIQKNILFINIFYILCYLYNNVYNNKYYNTLTFVIIYVFLKKNQGTLQRQVLAFDFGNIPGTVQILKNYSSN